MYSGLNLEHSTAEGCRSHDVAWWHKHSTVFLPYNYCIIGCGQAVEDKSSLAEASEETDAEKPKEEPKDKENTGQAKACLGYLILPTKLFCIIAIAIPS